MIRNSLVNFTTLAWNICEENSSFFGALNVYFDLEKYAIVTWLNLMHFFNIIDQVKYIL